MSSSSKSKDSDSLREHLKKYIIQGAIATLAAAMFIAGTYSYQLIARRVADSEWELPVLRVATAKDIRINQLLHDLLHETGSDRAWIFKFHNGGHLVGGVPFRKTSMSHEVVRPGVSRELETMKDIPLSAIPDAIELVVQNEHAFEIETKKIQEGFFKAVTERQATQFMVWKRLMYHGAPIGIIGIDYLVPRSEVVKKLKESGLVMEEMQETNGAPNQCTFALRCKVQTVGSLIEFEMGR